MALIAITDKKREANARNARHSTGPATADGKERVSRNAMTHGCSVSSSARVYKPLREEDPAYFNDLLEGYRQSWNPANRMEESYVHALAVTWIKIERSERWASTVLNRGMETRQRVLGQPVEISGDDDLGCCIVMTSTEGSPMWDKSQRHGSSAWREFHRLTDQLAKMQKLRLQRQPGAAYGSVVPAASSFERPAAEPHTAEPVVEDAMDSVESAEPAVLNNAQPSVNAPDMGLFCTGSEQPQPYLNPVLRVRMHAEAESTGTESPLPCQPPHAKPETDQPFPCECGQKLSV